MSDESAVGTGNHRWVIPFILHVSLLIAFIDRINISIALPKVGESFGWTEDQLASNGSLLLGAFYISYGLSNLLLSGLAAYIGPRRSLIGLVILFSTFTALGAPLSFSLPMFILTRVCLGLGEGVHFPMMNAVMKKWFPPGERSRANAIWVFGGTLATMLAPIILVPVIGAFGWKGMLIGCGVLGMCITVPLLWYFVYDTPRESPHISTEEVEMIESNLEPDEPTTAVWSFIGQPLFGLAVAGAILNNYCIYGVLNWLPTYFVEVRGIDFDQLTYAASLPYVAGFVGFVISAYLGDRTNRRVAMCAVGFFGAAISVFLATRAPNVPMTIAMFACGTFFQAAYISQEFVILQRILPASVIGHAAGIYNGFSVLFGAVGGSVMLGQIRSWTGSYDIAMYSVVGATLAGAVVMGIMTRFLKY